MKSSAIDVSSDHSTFDADSNKKRCGVRWHAVKKRAIVLTILSALI